MKSRWLKSCAALAILSLALASSGCAIPGAVTGGGWIPSSDGVAGDKANFGFSAMQCDFSLPPSGTFNYHDKSSSFAAPGSIKLNGSIADAGQCISLLCSSDADCTAASGGVCVSNPNLVGNGTICEYPGTALTNACIVCADIGSLGFALPTKTYGIDVNYTSTNATYPGTGVANICVVDNGQGSKAPSKDFALINVASGPYAGYLNFGFVQGNLSAKSCP